MLSKTQTRILQNILDGTERSLAETAIQSVIREKLPRFLTESDANLRRDFFVQIEIIASEATGRKISTHSLLIVNCLQSPIQKLSQAPSKD